MDIPDELIESIRSCMEGYPACAEDELRVVVSDFARAAQVAVLREMGAQLRRNAHAASALEARGLEAAANDLFDKAYALEAGAGQAEKEI